MSNHEESITTDVPLAARPRAPAPVRSEPTPANLLPAAPALGSFYAEGRALVDGRRMHLARMGILPEHATALAMPDLGEKAILPALKTEQLPAEVPEVYEPKTLRRTPEGGPVLEG
jgi:hypothetical protein